MIKLVVLDVALVVAFVVWSWNLREFERPFVLAYRVLSGKIGLRVAWRLMEAWPFFKACRRFKAPRRVRKARRLEVGSDEFHSSLDMDVMAMLEMTESEQEEYRSDLIGRRGRAHCGEMESHDRQQSDSHGAINESR